MPADTIHRHVDPLETAKEALELLKQGASFHIDFKGSRAAKMVVKTYLAERGYPVNDKGEHMTVSKGADAGHSDPRDGLDESSEMQRLLCDEDGSSSLSKQDRAVKATTESQHTLREFHEARGEESNAAAREASPYRPDVEKEDNDGDADPDLSSIQQLGQAGSLRGVSLTKALAALETMAANPGCSPELKAAVKSFASEQQEKTNAMVRSTQAQIQANPQSASGIVYNGEKLPDDSEHLAPTGKIEPEPSAHVTGRLEEELQEVQKNTKPGSITDRELFLREQITLAKLAASH